MIMKAKRWNESIDPTGYWISEKFDGHRALWDGRSFISSGGNRITPPPQIVESFPKEIVLDGELWAGYGNIGKVTSAVSGKRVRDWDPIIFAVFDAPEINAPVETRFEVARVACAKGDSDWIAYVSQDKCEGKEHLNKTLEKVLSWGGEGLVIRKPNSPYQKNTRSDYWLKVKKWFDAEAVVLDHIEGTRPGLCGALKVVNKDGLIFKVASGMTEVMAHNPPPIGTIITYKWDTLTKEGIPRPASFVRIREDI